MKELVLVRLQLLEFQEGGRRPRFLILSIACDWRT